MERSKAGHKKMCPMAYHHPELLLPEAVDKLFNEPNLQL